MTKRRVGIVGAGGVTETLHLPVLGAMPDLEVVWLCDTDVSKARALAARFDVKEAVTALADAPDVEGVLVATPVGTRRRILEAAFDRGWHVLAEKPFAVSLADHDAFLDLARAAGRVVCVGLMRRFYRSTQVARRLLAARPFGRVLELLAGEGGRQRGTGRAEDWYQSDPEKAGGGILVETGSHLLDQACFALGATSVEIERYDEIRVAGLEVDARIEASLGLADGGDCRARFVVSKAEDVPNGIWVRCERATVAFDTGADSPVRVLDGEGRLLGALSDEIGATQTYQAFHLEWADFLGSIRTGVAGIADAEPARVTTAIIDACYASVRAGTTSAESRVASAGRDGAITS